MSSLAQRSPSAPPSGFAIPPRVARPKQPVKTTPAAGGFVVLKGPKVVAKLPAAAGLAGVVDALAAEAVGGGKDTAWGGGTDLVVMRRGRGVAVLSRSAFGGVTAHEWPSDRHGFALGQFKQKWDARGLLRAERSARPPQAAHCLPLDLPELKGGRRKPHLDRRMPGYVVQCMGGHYGRDENGGRRWFDEVYPVGWYPPVLTTLGVARALADAARALAWERLKNPALVLPQWLTHPGRLRIWRGGVNVATVELSPGDARLFDEEAGDEKTRNFGIDV